MTIDLLAHLVTLSLWNGNVRKIREDHKHWNYKTLWETSSQVLFVQYRTDLNDESFLLLVLINKRDLSKFRGRDRAFMETRTTVDERHHSAFFYKKFGIQMTCASTMIETYKGFDYMNDWIKEEEIPDVTTEDIQDFDDLFAFLPVEQKTS